MCKFIPDYLIRHVLLNADKNRLKSTTKMVFQNMTGEHCLPLTPAGLLQFNRNTSDGKVARTIYDAEEKTNLPGKVVREEGGNPIDDEIVNRAYDFSGLTWEYYKRIFNRDSIDNKGFPLHATIHFGKNYPNAFWNNAQITMGDGDGEIFRNFTILDIVGHEWSHGLTSKTSNLEYFSQSGALNEHYSDVFGMCIKQYDLKQESKDSSWIIGEGIFQPTIQGLGIRSMKAPGTAYQDSKIGKDPQPDNMNDYYSGPEDSQGVHRNSGIPNKLFYEYSINMGGKAYEEPAKIWYQTLTTKLHRKSDFQDFVNKTQETIIQVYGTGQEYKAFREASKCVGLVPRHPIFAQMDL